ncbi:hypothetical protein FR742_19400 [Nonomuraea sp. C10]|nr:hypothetical protein FR742_19400 [Nonomuraea sp. C10]
MHESWAGRAVGSPCTCTAGIGQDDEPDIVSVPGRATADRAARRVRPRSSSLAVGVGRHPAHVRMRGATWFDAAEPTGGPRPPHDLRLSSQTPDDPAVAVAM